MSMVKLSMEVLYYIFSVLGPKVNAKLREMMVLQTKPLAEENHDRCMRGTLAIGNILELPLLDCKIVVHV
jgi:hypothetical protein